MFSNILSESQNQLLDAVKMFKRSFYLVGGTAIALQLGHRRSIDFDLFTYTKLNKRNIYKKLDELKFEIIKIGEDYNQIHYIINNVKFTFFNYPYDIPHKEKLNSVITMPNLLDLASMKAFALGRRAKWKDYVDLYFILNNNYTIEEISTNAVKYFDYNFSEKLFREQLAFHKDIDYSEKVDFVLEDTPSEDKIKEFLIKKASNF